MLGITRRDRKRKEWIRAQSMQCYYKSKNFEMAVWAGHVARRTDHRWTKEILDWIPRDIKRPRRRPPDEIRKHAGAMWMRDAADRLLWKNLGEAFIQQWIEKG